MLCCVGLHSLLLVHEYEDGIGYLFFFFFKQKTAHEMRMSDWSSDVCSSDLIAGSQTRRFTAGNSQQREHAGSCTSGANARDTLLYEDAIVAIKLDDVGDGTDRDQIKQFSQIRLRACGERTVGAQLCAHRQQQIEQDRKSTRLNSSH